jgi:hypothetical protein
VKPARDGAGSRSEPVKVTKPITKDQAARITWETLPTVPDVQSSLEVKPLFVLTGGNRAT